MSKMNWLTAAMDMWYYAAKFAKSSESVVKRRSLACKAFALVYADRANTGYKVK